MAKLCRYLITMVVTASAWREPAAAAAQARPLKARSPLQRVGAAQFAPTASMHLKTLFCAFSKRPQPACATGARPGDVRRVSGSTREAVVLGAAVCARSTGPAWNAGEDVQFQRRRLACNGRERRIGEDGVESEDQRGRGAAQAALHERAARSDEARHLWGTTRGAAALPTTKCGEGAEVKKNSAAKKKYR